MPKGTVESHANQRWSVWLLLDDSQAVCAGKRIAVGLQKWITFVGWFCGFAVDSVTTHYGRQDQCDLFNLTDSAQEKCGLVVLRMAWCWAVGNQKIPISTGIKGPGICLESWKNEALFSTAWYKLDVLRREPEVISSLFDPLGLISLRRCLCQWHRAGIEGREMQNCCVPWSDSIQLHLEHAILFTWLYFNKDIWHFVWKFLWLALVQFLLRMLWQISLSQSFLPTGCLLVQARWR